MRVYRGKRRPSVDQRWAAGPGFKGKEERPGQGKRIALLAGVNFPNTHLITSVCVPLFRQEQSVSHRQPE